MIIILFLDTFSFFFTFSFFMLPSFTIAEKKNYIYMGVCFIQKLKGLERTKKPM